MQNLMGLERPQFLITAQQMLFLAPEKTQLCCLFLHDLSPCDCDSESRGLSASFLTLKCCSVLHQPSYLIVEVFLSETNPWYFEILVLSAYKPQKFLSRVLGIFGGG